MGYKVLITSRIPDAALEMISKVAAVEQWQEEAVLPYSDLAAKIQDIDGLLCLLANKVDTGILEAAPNLKVISNYAVGFDNIDIEAATRRGIPVGNTPGVLSETTADLAFALLMPLPGKSRIRSICSHGQWQPPAAHADWTGLHHSTLGIVGWQNRVRNGTAGKGSRCGYCITAAAVKI